MILLSGCFFVPLITDQQLFFQGSRRIKETVASKDQHALRQHPGAYAASIHPYSLFRLPHWFLIGLFFLIIAQTQHREGGAFSRGVGPEAFWEM